MKPNRNDPCHCGSGKKYKNCHGKKVFGGSLSTQGTYLLFGAIVIAAGIGLYSMLSGDTSSSGGKLVPQPGPAPPGKVWSPEHGHWHDAPAAVGGAASGLTPQPPGPAPPGKVWSPEHGHWHDAPTEGGMQVQTTPQPTGTGLVPQPPGPTPPGKVWSPEHGHWHDAEPAQQQAGPPYPQPDGPVPEGKVWSPEHGHWHNAPPEP